DYGGPEEVVVFGDGLAGVDAYTDAERGNLTPRPPLRLYGEGERDLVCGFLEGDGALDGLLGAAEGGHEAVAHGFDFGAAVGREGFAGKALVLAQDVAAFGVAEALHHCRVGFDVGEENGAEGAGVEVVQRSFRSRFGETGKKIEYRIDTKGIWV